MKVVSAETLHQKILYYILFFLYGSSKTLYYMNEYVTGSENLGAVFHMEHLPKARETQIELGFQGREKRSKFEALNQKNKKQKLIKNTVKMQQSHYNVW